MKVISLSIWDAMSDPNKFEEFLGKLNNEELDRIFYFCLDDYLYFSPPSVFRQLAQAASNRNKKIEILVGAHSFAINEPKHLSVARSFWDTYWLLKTVVRLKPEAQSTDFKYHFTSLNNRAHPWRCEVIDLLAKYDLLQYGAVSWHKEDSIKSIDPLFKYFDNRALVLTDNYQNDKDQYVVPAEYSYSFSQLISESSLSIIEMSEKTSTALILGKPFLVAGAKDNMKLQNTLGFEWYDEIFDYSFDDEINQHVRFDKLIGNFVKLSKHSLTDLIELHDLVKDKIIHNQNRVKEITRNINSWPEPARFVVDVYETTGEIISNEIIDLYKRLKEYV